MVAVWAAAARAVAALEAATRAVVERAAAS